MKRAFTIIYSIFAIIIFFALFLFSALGLFDIYQDNQALCSGNLESLKKICVMWQQGIFNNQDLDKAVKEAVKKFDRLLVVTVYSPEKGLYYASSRIAPHTSSYLKSIIKDDPEWKDPDWRGIPVYQDRPFLGTEIIKAKILTDPYNDLVVEGVYVILTYGEISGVLKYGFIAISILLGLSIFMRFFIASEIKNNKEYTFDIEKPIAENDPLLNTTSPPELKQDEAADEIEIPLSENVQDSLIEEYEDINEELEKKIPDPMQPAEENNSFTSVKKEPARDLFSPKTGIGWEEYLLPRLCTEIKRTSSFDQDMSFALITINNHESLKAFDAVIQSVAKIILELFLFQDLCFEYGINGFGVILPDVDINQAIKEIEIFQRKIVSIQIKEQFITVSIGLSSRGGRLLNGEDLFNETKKALEMAGKDQKNNIVAFKPDPDKYRNVIAKKV